MGGIGNEDVPGLKSYEITVFSHEDARAAGVLYEEEYNDELESHNKPNIKIVGVCQFSELDSWDEIMSVFYSQYLKKQWRD